MIIKTMHVGILGTNCYLLCDETTQVCAVVDPGGDAPLIHQAITQLGYTLQAIYLTHGHFDHTDGVEGLCAFYPNVPVYLNPKDGRDATVAMRDKMPALTVPTVDYDEGTTLTLGSLTLSVLATPGHTPGSVILQCEDVLLAGDTLFAGSCGRIDLPGGSGRDMAHSLHRLALLPGDFAVYPGHMEPSTMERERKYNPYLRQVM